ncbi:MAG: YheC/YheD family endospore coat-associated protein [Desulfitobacteriaceae bacterium]
MINLPEPITLVRNHLTKGRWSLLYPEKRSSVTLHHGTRSYRLDLDKLPKTAENAIALTPRSCHTLLLPKHIREYKVRPLNSQNYLLGPLIGILVSETKLRKLLAGDPDPVYRRYVQVVRKNKGLGVFLSPERILWDKNQIVGVVRVTTDKQEVWIEETLPIPAVIYDRCFGSENRSSSKILRKQCAMHSPTIKVINALVKLEKRQVYTLCSQIPRFREHLPRWNILRPDNIDTLLKRFPVAYIKPDSLSKGKGVTKVSCTPSGYLVEQYREGENYQHLCTSSGEVLQDLEPYIGNRGFMVVQEAIPLMNYKGRPFDFRFLLQKDKSGKWKKTGVAGRISGKGSVISSPRSGGTVSTYDEVMAHQGKSNPKEIATEMLKLALDLAKTIDNVTGPFAELGFDFGVDVTGKVMIIEINGIPLKVSIERLKNRQITRCAHENPIEYAIYLAGFGGLYYD